MKHYRFALLMILLSIVMCACQKKDALPSSDTTTPRTDIFTTGPQPVPSESEEYISTSRDLGMLGIGVPEGYYSDGISPCVDYPGGEMRLPFFISSSGRIQEVGIGILLFLDGQPQPYRLEGETEYTYLHTFYPSEDTITLDFYFVPVTGTEGDALEFYAMSLLRPDYYPSQGQARTMVYSTGATVAGMRLIYQQTPPEAEVPAPVVRLKDVQVSQQDCPFEDIAGWTAIDMKTKIQDRHTANDIPPNLPNRIYEITPESIVDLHYELWGAEALQCNYVIFVDNIPISSSEGISIPMPITSGKKTVLDAKLTMTGFTGESAVYTIRVPKNYYTTDTDGLLQPMRVWFLLAGENPNK